MYQVIKNNQAKSLFKSDNSTKVYSFLRKNPRVIFDNDNDIMDSVIEIIQKSNWDNSNRKFNNIESLENKVQALSDTIYYAFNDDNEKLALLTTEFLDNYIDNYCTENKDFCTYVIKKLNNYKLGFSIVETE